MSWLKDRWEELSAQVNVRDGGRTASTVRASRNRPAPAQTRSTLSVGVARPQGRVSVDQPEPQRPTFVNKPLSQPKVTVDPIKTAPIRVGNQQIQNTTSIRPAEPIQRPLSKPSPVSRAISSVGAGTLRSGVGTVQGASGLYDLVTPGTGTNRLSKQADRAAVSLDRSAKDLENPIAYKGGQLATELLGFKGAGAVAKRGVAKSPQLTRATGMAVTKVANATENLYNTGARGRIAANTIRSAANPANLAAETAVTSKYIGEDASKGRQITPARVATDVAVGGAFNVGAPLAGNLIKEAVQPTTRLVKSAVNKVTAPTTNLVKPAPRVSVDEQAILRDYSDTLAGAYTPNPREWSDLIVQARQVGSKHGIDLTNGSVEERLLRTNSVLDQVGKSQRSSLLRNEGGYLGADGAPGGSPRPNQQGKTPVEPSTRLVSSSKNRTSSEQMSLPIEPQTTPPANKARPTQPQPKQELTVQPSRDLSQSRANLKVAESQSGTTAPQMRVQKTDQPTASNTSVSKIQQKTPIVNEGRRAISGADRTGYGLRESFDANENVPKELKEVLGAFGNERTVKSNKELWQNAQQRVGQDAANAMKYFADNSGDEAVATGYALINRYMKAGQTKEAGEIAMTMAERALEAGRTTQAYALMKRLTPEGSIQYVENKVARFVKQNPKQANKVNWDDKTRRTLYDMADKVNKLPEGRERNLLIGKMQQTVDNIFPSSVADKAVTVWKAGLLTSLRTHERNILGNSINAAAEQLSTAPGSLVDRLMSLRTGNRSLVVSTGEGMGKGAKEGAQIAKDQILTGIDVTNSNLKYNINHITWKDNKVEQGLKKFTEAVFRPLGAEDKLFKESARKNALYNLAIADAKNKKLKGAQADSFIEKFVNNPSAKAMEIADNDAGRATFSHDNVLGDIIREAKGSVRRSNRPGAQAASAFLDILMPFTQVPSGVASQLYAYSPAKLAKSTYDIGKVFLTAGGKDIDTATQRQIAQGFGRSVIGTSIAGAGLYLASKGVMTGQPRDDAEKAQWEAQGIKPNSVKVGDRWYGLSSIGPQNLLLLAGAQIEQDKKAGENQWLNFTANMGKNFKDQTFLKGMSSALDAVGDPQRYMDSFVQQQATSVVPNIVKDIARAFDPNERESKSIQDRFMQSIPGLSKNLPERKDSYGQTLKNSGALELVDLFNSSKQKDVPAAKFAEQLREATGLKEHIPSKVERSITLNGEQKKLTAKEYSAYQDFVGNESKKFIEKAQTSLNSLSDEEKVKKIDSALKDINEAAKIKLFGAKSDEASKNAKRILTGQEISTYTSSINDSIPREHKELLAKYDTMDERERDDYIRTNNDAEYKLALANFANDKAEGKLSRVEEMRRKNELSKKQVGAGFDKDVREFYELSKGDIEDYITGNNDGEEVAKKLLAYDDALVKAGVIEKNKFRDKYGSESFITKKKGSGGKGGKKSKYDYTKDLFGTGTSSSSTSKSLRAILEAAMAGKKKA